MSDAALPTSPEEDPRAKVQRHINGEREFQRQRVSDVDNKVDEVEEVVSDQSKGGWDA